MKQRITDLSGLMLFTVLVLAAVLTACGGDDITEGSNTNAAQGGAQAAKTYHFCSVIGAKGDGENTINSFTAALSDEGSAKSENSIMKISISDDGRSLDAIWAVGEQIAIVNEAGTAYYGTVAVTSVNSDGSAVVEGTVTGITDGDAIKMVYPATAVNTSTGAMVDIISVQDGAFETINSNRDLVTGNGKITIIDGKATVNGHPAMDNVNAICKFTFNDKSTSTALNVTKLVIKNKTTDALISTITPASATNALYVVMAPTALATSYEFIATAGDTDYEGTATATIRAGKYYGSLALNMSEPELSGYGFTINSSGTKVKFAPGNLQATYNGSTWTWAFAAHQYDYIGNAASNTSINGNGSVSANGTVDLFGWSTSATQNGIHNSMYDDTYSGNFVDWGGLTITNADGYTWRTTTSAEWTYIFNTRTSGATVNGVSNARYAHATINTDGTAVNGIILFPDGCKISAASATTWGAINSNSAYATKCTTAQWAHLEELGCVFLPTAGFRSGTWMIDVGAGGYYWSSSPSTSYVSEAYAVYFYSGDLHHADSNSRHNGRSVRLVRDVVFGTQATKADERQYGEQNDNDTW